MIDTRYLHVVIKRSDLTFVIIEDTSVTHEQHKYMYVASKKCSFFSSLS
jgi:hypothetical protein